MSYDRFPSGASGPVKRVALVLACASLVLAAPLSAGAGSRDASANPELQKAEACIHAAIRKEDLASKYLAEYHKNAYVEGGTITPQRIADVAITPALKDLQCALDAISQAHNSGEISQAETSDARSHVAGARELDQTVHASFTGVLKYRNDTTDLAEAKRDKNEALAILARATPGKVAGPIHTYHYKVTIEVSATGNNFVDSYAVPGTNPTYNGSMSASFTIVFPGVFTVDDKAHTVDAGPFTSTSGSGTDSLTLTVTDPAQPSATCTVPAHTPFKAVGSLTPVWGGGPDGKSYGTGVMRFSLHADSTTSKVYRCNSSNPSVTTVTIQPGITIPGAYLGYANIPPSKNPAAPNPGCVSGVLTDIYVPIRVSALGKQIATTTFRPGPIKCQATVLGALYTAHIVYAITLERTG